MIKFFRNIRHHMIKENKVSSYLLYAIGEIILVVIGILIALQINNWNITRLENIAKKQYLINLKDNLFIDQESLIKKIKISQKRIKEFDTLVDMLMNPSNYSKAAFKEKASIARQFSNFVAMKATYDNLNNTGNLNLLGNQKLINDLFLYYNQIDYYNIGVGELAQNFSRNEIGPLIERLDFYMSPYLLTEREKDVIKDHLERDTKETMQDYTLNPELGNLLISKRLILKGQHDNFNTILKMNNDLIESIDEEIR